jgi:hypothetical protein
MVPKIVTASHNIKQQLPTLYTELPPITHADSMVSASGGSCRLWTADFNELHTSTFSPSFLYKKNI